MLGIAHEFGNAHIVQTLEQARRTLLRQTSDTRKLDPAVIAAARELRLRRDEEVLAARARCTVASVAQRLATNSVRDGAPSQARVPCCAGSITAPSAAVGGEHPASEHWQCEEGL